jgi:aminocarboxymuconate-semialdehyde decarboxylase
MPLGHLRFHDTGSSTGLVEAGANVMNAASGDTSPPAPAVVSGARRSRPTAVDIHGHCVPRSFLEALARTQAFGTEVERSDGRYVVRLPGGPPLRPIGGVMLDGPHRAAWMVSQGICHQVVGPWLDLQGQQLSARAGPAWARLLNDSLAETVANAGGKLTAYATVHLADPDIAAAELRRATAVLGLRGVMLPATLPFGRLSDSRYDPIWSLAAQLRLPVMIHPTTDSPASRLLIDYPLLKGMYGRNIETSLVTAELIVAGVMDRFAGLVLIAPHGGGLLPYQTGRFDRDFPQLGKRGRVPSELARTLHYDTVLMSEEALRFLYEFAGPERVMLGSDFGATPAQRTGPSITEPVRSASSSTSAVQAVLTGNARRLFGITDKPD